MGNREWCCWKRWDLRRSPNRPQRTCKGSGTQFQWPGPQRRLRSNWSVRFGERTRPKATAWAHWPAFHALLILSSDDSEEPDNFADECKNLWGQLEKDASISLLISWRGTGIGTTGSGSPPTDTKSNEMSEAEGEAARWALSSKAKTFWRKEAAEAEGPWIVIRRSPTEQTSSTLPSSWEPLGIQVSNKRRVPVGAGMMIKMSRGESGQWWKKKWPQSPKSKKRQTNTTDEAH